MKKTVLLLALLLALPAWAKRPFTIEDLYRLRTATDLSVSEDGKRIAFTVATSDLPRAKRSTRIWLGSANGIDAHPVTLGDKDSAPSFSPDGKWLAFVRERDEHVNLWLLPLEGGEPKQLTTIGTGVSDPVWSDDSKMIAFSSDVYPECGGDDACNERLSKQWSEGKTNAHMADALLYRHWTAWRDGMVTHTFVADVDSGKVRDLTPGKNDFPPFQLGGPAQYDFSPDGSELVVAANPDEVRATSTNNDLFLISLTGDNRAPRNITAANKSYDGSPLYSPDGKFIAYRIQKQPGFESDLVQLALYDRKAGTSRVISGTFDNWIDDFQWSNDSRSIYFTGPVEGRNPIYRLDVASGAITKVHDDRSIDEFEISGDGKSIYYIARSVGEPTEVYRAPLGGKRTAITSLNAAVASEVDIRPAEVLWVTGAEGMRVQVFLVKPHDFDPAKKYPLILNIHGGPQQQWADTFRGDWQVYPGAGYVVAFANPTGSTGFGQKFTADISRNWGGRPYEDLMRVTDALEKLPYVDRDRIGAMGWSYGGYMINWIAGHTDRYKALASMMGLFDLRSFYYSTEELWFPEWDLGGTPYNSDLFEKWSPSNFVKNFKTPTLVISGELDFRVPYTQSLQMFTALQKMNVPSRLVIFKNAGHWPSSYEMALYYTAHLEWFHKYLGGGAPPWTTEQFLRNQVFDASTGDRRSTGGAPQ